MHNLCAGRSWLRKALFPLLLIIAANPQLAAEQGAWRYSESFGQNTAWIEYSVVRTPQRVVVRSAADRVKEELEFVPGKGTLWWTKIGSHPGTNLRAQRTGDTIRITGTLKSAKVDKLLHIDSAPWYQILGPCIGDLLPQKMQSIEFWALDPDELAVHKMLAIRQAGERKEVHHVLIDTFKVHFAPMGIAGAFWGADFWFRISDSAYILSKMPDNGGLTETAIDW